MDSVGLFVFGIIGVLFLAAMILPQIERQRKNK